MMTDDKIQESLCKARALQETQRFRPRETMSSEEWRTIRALVRGRVLADGMSMTRYGEEIPVRWLVDALMLVADDDDETLEFVRAEIARVGPGQRAPQHLDIGPGINAIPTEEQAKAILALPDPRSEPEDPDETMVAVLDAV